MKKKKTVIIIVTLLLLIIGFTIFNINSSYLGNSGMDSFEKKAHNNFVCVDGKIVKDAKECSE